MNNKISFALFGTRIRVVMDGNTPMIPLKQLAGVIGIDRRKLVLNLRGRMLGERLGMKQLAVQVDDRHSINQQCIRVDRVATLLNAIDPQLARDAGHDEMADYLQRRQHEWDIYLSAYANPEQQLVAATS